MDSVDPIRSCPSVGPFDHGMLTPWATKRPGRPSLPMSAWNVFAAASSRTTTTSLVATLPSKLRQPK